MDVYILKCRRERGGDVISVHARRQGADAAMSGFSAADQAQLEIVNRDVQDDPD